MFESPLVNMFESPLVKKKKKNLGMPIKLKAENLLPL